MTRFAHHNIRQNAVTLLRVAARSASIWIAFSVVVLLLGSPAIAGPFDVQRFISGTLHVYVDQQSPEVGSYIVNWQYSVDPSLLASQSGPDYAIYTPVAGSEDQFRLNIDLRFYGFGGDPVLANLYCGTSALSGCEQFLVGDITQMRVENSVGVGPPFFDGFEIDAIGAQFNFSSQDTVLTSTDISDILFGHRDDIFFGGPFTPLFVNGATYPASGTVESVSPIPEPSTILILGLGLLALGAVYQRKHLNFQAAFPLLARLKISPKLHQPSGLATVRRGDGIEDRSL